MKETPVAAYVIYQADVLDADRYALYTSRAAPNVVAAGGRFVVRGGDIEVLEGDPPPPRTSILEFPTRQAARAWYFSDDYTKIRQLREGASRSRMYIVDGID
jgi:uncharacterized protein (DUF1330 family)